MVRASYSRSLMRLSFASTRSPVPSVGWPFLSGIRKMRGGLPSPVQVIGRAVTSPSGSAPVTSSTAISGRDCGGATRLLRPRSTAPSASRSFRSSFSFSRSALPLSLKARAISRLPTGVALLRMKERTVSLSGKLPGERPERRGVSVKGSRAVEGGSLK